VTLSTILTLAIGLTYVYLLLSLVASAVAEFISGYWNLRGTGLRDCIRHWLDDPTGAGLAGALYDHKLIAGLIKPGMNQPSLKWLSWLIPAVSVRLPSYIPKETIADALIDILDRENAFKTGTMQPGLAALWRSAQKKAGTDPQAAVKSFRDQVMKWFDDAVSRQSETYTRRSQYRLFFIGLVIAIALNADSLKIATALWLPASIEQTKALRETAEQLIAAGVPFDQSPLENLKANEVMQQIESLGLPIGWGKGATGCDVASHVLPDLVKIWPFSWIGRQFCSAEPSLKLEGITAAKWLGWLITALAISFGAQFWFDALGSFVRLRSGGAQPKSNETPAASKG